jgi:hypothetical protein
MKDVLTSDSMDKWAWWPTACTVVMLAFFVFVGNLPGPLNMLMFLLSLLACPAVALLLIVSACVLAWHRRPRGAASALIALTAPVILVSPMALLEPYVHLALMLTFGIGYIGPKPPRGDAVAIYDWSTGMVGSPNTFLIHDTTDAIASPQALATSAAWRNKKFLPGCGYTAQHLTGHYYVIVTC